MPDTTTEMSRARTLGRSQGNETGGVHPMVKWCPRNKIHPRNPERGMGEPQIMSKTYSLEKRSIVHHWCTYQVGADPINGRPY